MRCAPARPVRARCVQVCFTALLPSRNMTCVRTCCNATPSKDFLLHQPSPCVRAVCACVALLPSRNMTCVRPPCTARQREDFLHTSQFRLNILHFTSHTSSPPKPHFSNFLQTANFYTEKLLHRSPYTEKVLQTATLYSQQAFDTEKFLHK